MSLYRTYRPQTFADVVGQDHVVTTLEHAAAQGKIAHAYLFAGARGTGKTSVARILAKAILTRGVDDETLARQIVRGVEDGSIVDLIEIDAASNRGIDDIRSLIERIEFAPVVTHAKVYIIDEVHMLTREAFNALLKTLEEPPPYAYFILATTELHKIPATIQSRCQRYTFRHIREDDIVRRLQHIADQEHITVDRAALRAIAHHAQGGMRDGISLLDQLRSLEKIGLEEVRERMGASGEEEAETILKTLEEKDRTGIVTAVRHAEDAGIPLDGVTRSLLGMLRQRLHAAIEAKQQITAIVAMLDILLEAIKNLRVAPIPGLVLESALLSLCGQVLPEKLDSTVRQEKDAVKKDTIKTELTPKDPETSRRTTQKERKEPDKTAKQENESPAAATIEAPELTMAAILRLWPSIVDQATPAAVKMSLKNGRVMAIEDLTVTVSFSSRFHRDRVSRNEATYRIEENLRDVFKRPLKLLCIVEEDREPVMVDAKAVDLAEAVTEIF
ncbi:DNA polymerase III subunit gamma/tau [Candidatus Peregrinibacteria bacterium]|nr:DNA polymerase III subunit gamma/tau [Candidatus Peregrinibacteria bacterium]MBI3816299.1 DNA polymerase III subunit gamma/tau [Candidatus Peregrinibacteria bacterium]